MSEIALPQQVEAESTGIVQRANSLVVTSDDELRIAAEIVRGIKTVLARIADTFDGPISAAHKAHKAMIDAKKRHEQPLRTAEATVKGKMAAYQREQEQKRRQEEARLREQARREEEERRMREAEALEAQGEQQAALAVIEAPMPTVVVPKSAPKIEGVSTRLVWKFRIVEEAAIPRQYMMPNEKAIGAAVRSLGKNCVIPGVEVYSEDIIAAKGF